jgi:hypothetical protein
MEAPGERDRTANVCPWIGAGGVRAKDSRFRAVETGDWTETECQGRPAVPAKVSRLRVVEIGDQAGTECQGRAAVLIEPVSANSLCKTGIFRERAGDFPPFSRRRFGDREPGDQIECVKSPDFRACEAQVVNCRQLQDCLAGVRGFELTHSRSNPVSICPSVNLGIWASRTTRLRCTRVPAEFALYLGGSGAWPLSRRVRLHTGEKCCLKGTPFQPKCSR